MFRPLSLLFALLAFGVFQTRCSSKETGSNPLRDAGTDGGGDGTQDGGGDRGRDGGPDGGTGRGIQTTVGAPDGGFPPFDAGSDVVFDPDAGGVRLRTGGRESRFAWIANYKSGWVSKFDTRTGHEVARYYSVIPLQPDGGTSSVRAHYRDGGVDNGLFNSPSRTAIDLNGDVWVANRAPCVQGSVTKIANDLADCRHSLPDGGVRTSVDLNDNGRIDPDEFIEPTNLDDWHTYDDCVLFSVPLGANPPCDPPGDHVKVRALAISGGSVEGSPGGIIWAGHWAENNIYKLHSDGQLVPARADGGMAIHLSWGSLDTMDGGCLPECDGPYGAAVDGNQRLWVVSTGTALLALINTPNGELVSDQITPPPDAGEGIDSFSSYGIAIDGRRDGGSPRVWLGGWVMAPYGTAWRYDHGPGVSAAPGTWKLFKFDTARSQRGTNFGYGRGIAADTLGYIWMSGSFTADGTGVAQLIGFNAEDGTVKKFRFSDGGTADFIDVTDDNADAGTAMSIGVGLDSDHNIWVNNHGIGTTGTAMKVTRDDGVVTITPPQVGNLYTYSDFTGYQLRNFTAPQGAFTQDFCDCVNARWGPVNWVATLPAGTNIEFYFKVASNQGDLDNAPRHGPYRSGSTLQPEALGQCLRAQFVLYASSDSQRSPVLRSYTIGLRCPGPG